MPHDADLYEVLAESQRLGFLGARPIDEVIEHAQSFVDALVGIQGPVADLGAGGGVPGLVIARARPDLPMTLIDRRTKRTDFLQRMIRRLDLQSRVTVLASDVEDVIDRQGGDFSAVVARGFGPPLVTLSAGVRLASSGGLVVISEPPAGDRWDPAEVAELRAVRVASGSDVAVFRAI